MRPHFDEQCSAYPNPKTTERNHAHDHYQQETTAARELVAARQRRQQELPLGRPASSPARSSRSSARSRRAAASNDEYRARYLDEIAPSGIVGRVIKYARRTAPSPSTTEKVPEDTTFAALCDETLGRLREVQRPRRAAGHKMGLLYQGFVMPQVESLPDRDESQWELGLDGEPADPWGHWMYLPLQNVDTLEVDTFVTSSKTGRSAVGVLLKHYERLRKDHAGEVPLVQLRSGGFQHKDPRVGWVNKPMFVIVGQPAGRLCRQAGHAHRRHSRRRAARL